jgi:hypothetical protein
MPERFNANSIIGSTDNGTNSNKNNIRQGMLFATVKAWIFNA